ncbi:MAG: hypothetical protein ACE5IL_07605 [Myxococcota bacterium]
MPAVPRGFPRSSPSPELPWLERWLLPYMRESLLWPVLAAIVGHIVAVVAPALLYALRDHSPLGALALALLLALSVGGAHEEVRQCGRPGALGGVILVTWILSGAVALAADHYGLL